jgi:hypothetical protein
VSLASRAAHFPFYQRFPEATVRRASIPIILLILASLLVSTPGAAQQRGATR